MKKLAVLLILIFFLLSLSACDPSVNMSTPRIEKFKRAILTEYKQIKYLRITHSRSSIDFRYTSDNNLDECKMFDIFYKTRNFLQDEHVQKEIFDVIKPTVYPEAYIRFDLNNDEIEEYQFYSLYYKQPYRDDRVNEIDGYKTWYYTNSEAVKPVPEKKAE